MFKFAKYGISGAILATGAISTPCAASDMSPNLLIQSAPSDQPAYRRMVIVRYLDGPRIRASYKAYNRREFINLPNQGMLEEAASCANNRATPLSQIKAFERAEAKRKRAGQAPETRSFCIKNINNWSAGNKDKYLDPIFAGMPYVSGRS